jgi:hypothetical protein
MHSVTTHRTTAMLLTSIAAALNTDGATVEPEDIDSSGMSIIVDGFRYRLEIDPDPELLDDADWCRHLDRRLADLAAERHDAFIGETDPAGINGQEHPDDLEF